MDNTIIVAILANLIAVIAVGRDWLGFKGGILGNKKTNIELAKELSGAIRSKDNFVAEFVFNQLYGKNVPFNTINYLFLHSEPSEMIKQYLLVSEKVELGDSELVYRNNIWKYKSRRKILKILAHLIYWPSAFITLSPIYGIIGYGQISIRDLLLLIPVVMIFGLISYNAVKVIWTIKAFERLKVK